MKDMEAKAIEYKLTSLERIKACYLASEPFTINNDMITPTFKVKRHIAKKRFQEEIDRMYAEGVIPKKGSVE